MFKDFYQNELNERLTKVDGIPNVNCGGCAFVAFHIYNALKNKGFDTKYIILGEGDDIYHVMVLVDNYLVDSTGIYENTGQHPYFDYVRVCTLINEKELERRLKNHRWNPRFKTRYIPLIEKYIHK